MVDCIAANVDMLCCWMMVKQTGFKLMAEYTDVCSGMLCAGMLHTRIGKIHSVSLEKSVHVEACFICHACTSNASKHTVQIRHILAYGALPHVMNGRSIGMSTCTVSRRWDSFAGSGAPSCTLAAPAPSGEAAADSADESLVESLVSQLERCTGGDSFMKVSVLSKLPREELLFLSGSGEAGSGF